MSKEVSGSANGFPRINQMGSTTGRYSGDKAHNLPEITARPIAPPINESIEIGDVPRYFRQPLNGCEGGDNLYEEIVRNTGRLSGIRDRLSAIEETISGGTNVLRGIRVGTLMADTEEFPSLAVTISRTTDYISVIAEIIDRLEQVLS